MDSISFKSTEALVGERGGSVQIILLRQGDLNGAITAEYRTGDGTAVAGADYGLTTGIVTFGSGETEKLVSIPILDDALSEGSESFSVQLLSVNGGTVGFPRTTRVVIQDDETPSGATPPDPSSLAITPETPVVRGLVEPTNFGFVPGRPNTIVIGEKSGLIKVAQDGVVLNTPLLDLRAMVNDVRDRGLIDIALNPNFATQPYLYAYFTVDPPETATNPAGSYAGPDGLGNRYVQLVRYTVDTVQGRLQVRPDSGVVLLGSAGRSLRDVSGGGTLLNEDRFDQPPSGIRPDGTNIQDFVAADSITHAGGALKFGPDGKLYVTVGDGAYFGSADTRTTRVQDIGNLSGKVLRIDPLTGAGLPDNPFYVAGAPDANQSKVYQLGLRNGFRMTFDGGGKLFVGDVGWYSYEEINTGGPGANFGWPYFEGGQNGANVPTPSFRDLPQAQAFYASGAPVAAPFQAFSHLESDPGFALQAIVMGDFYTGAVYPGVLRNNLFFSSLTSGQIFAVDPSTPTPTVNLIGTQNATIVAMHQGPDGVLYYADIVGGTISRLQISATATLPPANAVIGTGTDEFVLRVQQDAYQGSAQYSVSIDGVQIGGVLTASATRASGQFDTVTLRANLAPGNHRAEVRLLNDLYAGAPNADRNLYVDSASYNGAAIPLSARELFNPEPKFIDFIEAAPVAPAPAGNVTVGTGPDALVLRLQQDAYQGNAQYIVRLDGVQIGGLLTASATRASGQSDTLTVRADLAPGNHRAEVRFVNDLYAGTADTDRNLFVNSASYNGATIPLSARELFNPEPKFIDFSDASSAAAGNVTVGTGPDALVLRLQQDAYQGNAQYTVSLDGVQVGGILTASATRLSGQSDTLTVRADLAPGDHRAEIRFLNDLYAGTADTDRNLFVNSASYNGDTIPLSARELFNPEPKFISFREAAPNVPGNATIGAGPDALTLFLQEDAFQGDAQYTVSLDGVQVGGVLTAAATRASGTFNTVTVYADLAAGEHRAEIRFLNDAYAGTAATDRNLFVTGATYNGAKVGFAALELFSQGAASFTFNDTTPIIR